MVEANRLVHACAPPIQNHRVAVDIGESDEPIPIHFAYPRDINISATFPVGERPLRDFFDTPDLAAMDDAIVNGTLRLPPGAPAPLSLFRAARTDYSLHRLYHYTGTDPEYFQNFVILTNYQFYADAFALMGRERMRAGDSNGDIFVEPGNVVTRNARLGDSGPAGAPPGRMPQMPAWHLVQPDSGDRRPSCLLSWSITGCKVMVTANVPGSVARELRKMSKADVVVPA
jgi:AMP nucleosidase